MQSQYHHLQPHEREQVEVWRAHGKSCRQIACELNRSHSTISRECRRGFWPDFNRYTATGGKRFYQAGRRSAGRARRKLPVDDMSSPLWQFCLRMLRSRLSPEQISGVLRHCSPLDPSVAGVAPFVCTQSIYQALTDLPHSPLRSELTRCLRRSRGGRRYRRRTNPRLAPIQNFQHISERPVEVDLRIEPGHLEGDLMVGAKGQSFLGVIVERISLRIWLVKLHSSQPAHVREQFAKKLRCVPAHLRRSLTYDRGREMAEHQLLSRSLGMPIYFCNPYSPWQRGTVENTNGLLRQYFPKGTDFRNISQQRLDEVERELNSRPRKKHLFSSPSQVFAHYRQIGRV